MAPPLEESKGSISQWTFPRAAGDVGRFLRGGLPSGPMLARLGKPTRREETAKPGPKRALFSTPKMRYRRSSAIEQRRLFNQGRPPSVGVIRSWRTNISRATSP